MDRELRKSADGQVLTCAELREQRLQDLMDTCQREVLQQIIGPFGLSPAMFDDKRGGSVTTQHNFEKGVTATPEDQARHDAWRRTGEEGVNRQSIDAELNDMRKPRFQNPEPLIDAYTGKELNRDGRTHFDHVVPVNEYEQDAGANLFQSKERRQEVLNSKENLVPTDGSINQSMSDKDKKEWSRAQRKKDPGKTNAESFGVDEALLNETYETAHQHVNTELRKDQLKKQAKELTATSVDAAKRQALRKALGMLLHEFVNQSFVEVKGLLRDRQSQENFLDALGASLKRVAKRVLAKLKDALNALVSGGVEGVVSNLVTFLINNFITTSAKVVTLIRESMSGLWRAVKTLFWPEPGISGLDQVREASKIIAATLTMGLGLLLEESVKAFILTVPLLAPVAEVVAPALTAIATGLLTALVVYGIDRLFDAISSKGTELLEVFEGQASAQQDLMRMLAELLQGQVLHSRLLVQTAQGYTDMSSSLEVTHSRYERASLAAKGAISSRHSTIGMIEDQISAERQLQADLESLLNSPKSRDQK